MYQFFWCRNNVFRRHSSNLVAFGLALIDQARSDLMHSLNFFPLNRFYRYDTHVHPAHRFTVGFGTIGVVLIPFDLGV